MMIKRLPTMFKGLRWISCNIEKRTSFSFELPTEKDGDDCMGMEDRKLSGKKGTLCCLRTYRTMENRCHEAQVLPRSMADGAESTTEYDHLCFNSLPTKIFMIKVLIIRFCCYTRRESDKAKKRHNFPKQTFKIFKVIGIIKY